MTTNPYDGDFFSDFLDEQNMHEECKAAGIKKLLAMQLAQAMERQNITKQAMADQMHTSRSQLDRLLNPNKTGVSLEVMQRAASVVGHQLRIELVPVHG